MRDDARDRPSYSSVLGWKRCAAAKKGAATVTLKGPLASCCIFQNLYIENAVDRCFCGEKAGFSPMLTMGRIAEQPHRTHSAGERAETRIRKRGAMIHRGWIGRKVAAKIAIRSEHAREKSGSGHEPVRIDEAQTRRACHDLFLIFQKNPS